VYGKNFNSIYNAMKTVDPSIYLGICGYAGSESNRAWTGAVFNNPGTVTIELSEFTTSGAVNLWVLSGDSLASPTCTLNGVGNGLEQGGPVVEDVTPYYWDVGTTFAITVNIEKTSITSLVIY
jgi:hypothetical protein